MDGKGAAAAAAGGAKAAVASGPASVEQCRVLQQVIKLLEHTDEAKKMLPLANMTPEMLQTTLQNSTQPINVADVLTKLMQHLEPAVAAPLWQQYRAGAPSSSSDGAAAAAAAPSQSGPVAPGAPNPAHAKINRAKFAANSNKCGVCGETYHSSFSPLVLCDFCPGAYHVCCLGMDWADLPEAEWACNKCMGQPLPPPRGLLAAGQLLNMEQERQKAMLRALSAGSGSLAGINLAAVGLAAGARSKLAAAHDAKMRDDAARAKLDAKRFVRYQPDDLDLAAEEAAEAQRLSSLLPQLQDAAQREGGGRGRRSGKGGDDDEESGDLPPLPPGGRRMIPAGSLGINPYGMVQLSAGEQLREASDRLKRLQATAAGPPALKDTITGARQVHGLMDAFAVAEFLACFGTQSGAPPLDLLQLQAAVAWPLDGPELSNIYIALVKYLLAQWSNIESGHVGARVKRWARCLERSCALGQSALLEQAAALVDEDDDDSQPHPPPNGSATWQELLRRYCLLSRSSLRVSESQLTTASPEAYATMTDDLIMVHAAVELGRKEVWAMPPEFHLRLLCALCNDVVNCYNMKAEILGRLDTSIALQVEKFHADAEERRKEKEAARIRREAAQAARDKRMREMAAAMAAGGNGAFSASDPAAAAATPAESVDDGGSEPPLKRARSSSAGVDASSTGFAAADSADGTPGLDCREDTPGDLAHGGWRAGDDRELRDAALNAELARYMIRTEPLGTDRNHQRYWYMHSFPHAVFVESSEGDSLGVITTKAQLDTLMHSLNRRGPREMLLHAALLKRYPEILRNLRPLPGSLDIRDVPRSKPWGRQRRRLQKQHWLSAAAEVLPVKQANGAAAGQQQQPKVKQQTGLLSHDELQVQAERVAVAAALSELELLVTKLVGVGIYDLQPKHWRQRLHGKTTVDDLCQVLEDIEAALSRVGDGRPNVSDEAVKDFIRDADIYEAEFVMPVSAAELAEQQEAAAAAAAAAAAEAAAAANGDADASAEQAEAPEPVKPPAGNSKSKGKKAPPSNKKGAKAPGGKKGKKGAADEAADEDLSNPDASALRGPLVTLFSGATRVRKKNVRAAAATLKAEDGGSSGGGAGIKREPSEGGLDADADGAAGGSPSKDEDVAKMVSPLEELDDSDVEAEKRYLEKRAAEKAGEPIPPPPVVLWRSQRELGVWLKDLRRARSAGALGGATYAAASLVDRAHRLMSNLALSRIRTGQAAYLAEDRESAALRKADLLLGPTPTDAALQAEAQAAAGTAAAAAIAAAEDARNSTIMMTSSGRRVKGSAASEPKGRKLSARQRKQRNYAAMGYGSDDEFGYSGYGDSGSYGYEEDAVDEEPAPPPPEGKYGLACLACGGGGEVACCEVPGCGVLMHLGCAGMPLESEVYFCPDHLMVLQMPWTHSVPPPDKFMQQAPPPVRPSLGA